MRYYLGIDVGGSKTHALVADETGQCLGLGEAGPGNHEVVGYDGLSHALQYSTGQALRQAGITVDQIAGAGFGVAGYDWPTELPDTLASIRTLGLACPIEAVNDTIVGLVAGARRGWGVVVVAGTSNNCRGRDRLGREGRVSGNGTRFGEYGGAVELVERATHMVAYEWTRRGVATALSQAFIELCGAKDLSDLIEKLATHQYFLPPLVARIVFQVAEAGDEVAREVIAWAGRELGMLAVSVIRQLNFEEQEFDVVLSGSLYAGGSLLTEPMRQTIQAVAPRAEMVRLNAPPVVGGVLLGMEKAGLDGYAVRDRLVETANILLQHIKSDG